MSTFQRLHRRIARLGAEVMRLKGIVQLQDDVLLITADRLNLWREIAKGQEARAIKAEARAKDTSCPNCGSESGYYCDALQYASYHCYRCKYALTRTEAEAFGFKVGSDNPTTRR